MTNLAYQSLVGDRDIVGKPLREALPEVVDQGFVTLLDYRGVDRANPSSAATCGSFCRGSRNRNTGTLPRFRLPADLRRRRHVHRGLRAGPGRDRAEPAPRNPCARANSAFVSSPRRPGYAVDDRPEGRLHLPQRGAAAFSRSGAGRGRALRLVACNPSRRPRVVARRGR